MVEKFHHAGKVEVSTWFRRNWNIFTQTFVFAVAGFSKCLNLSPCKIGIRLPAEDDVDCVVPGEVSVSKAYKVCYISI